MRFSIANSTATSGTSTFSGGVSLLSNAQITSGTGGSVVFSGVLNGTGGLTKTGGGAATLTGTNNFTGATTVSAGSLTAAGTSGAALGSTSAVAINSGSLILGANNQINNSAGMTLAGGTFNTGGFSETGGTLEAPTAGLGALTFSSSSTLDFGNGNSVVTFANVSYTTGTFTIENYTPGTDHLFFAVSDISNTFVANINFGEGYNVSEINMGSYTEVVATAIPEPATVCGVLALVGLAGYRERRRFAKLLRRA